MIRSAWREMVDTYRTLAASRQAEPPKSKGSRFIGEAFPVASEADALTMMETVRAREHAATHVCWAYRLGADGSRIRSADDGEPSGTAGLPILREIEGRDLTDCLVTVTRYYGGTKLGAGGLARAYGEAAATVLDASPVRTVVVRVPVELRFAFADTSAAMRQLDVFDAKIAAQDYTPEGTVLTLDVRCSQVDALAAAFVEATSGRGDCRQVQRDT
ncbi:MAG: YigZ family protein [Bacteroidota bacterium]